MNKGDSKFQPDLATGLPSEWFALLEQELSKPCMHALQEFLQGERAAGKEVYPPPGLIFNAFRLTPPGSVKVVILGQDPYHNPGQAHGLCFSVPEGLKLPPSLKNIFREVSDELGLKVPACGCLDQWATRGVLLLNSTLTVERNRPGAHQGLGWEAFTDRVISLMSERATPKVFMLWGVQAQKKQPLIDESRHCVLRAPHPSPLSAHRGFFGCGHFRAANAFLTARGERPIDWELTAEG